MEISRTQNPSPHFDFSREQNLQILDRFEKELCLAYHPDVVLGVLNRLPKEFREGLLSLSPSQKNFIELYCHYNHEIKKIKEQWHTFPSSHQRLLKQFNGLIERALYQYLPRMDHASIENCMQTLRLIAHYLPSLLKSFNEDILHRYIQDTSIKELDIFLGQAALPSLEELTFTIQEAFQKELQLRSYLETNPQESLVSLYDTLKIQIKKLPHASVRKELLLELALKSGMTKDLRCPLNPANIRAQARLFEASRIGGHWIEQKKEMISYGESLNPVYFLNNPEGEEEALPVAVLKNDPHAGALETLIWDAAMIFGVEDGLVPTKIKKIDDYSGSIQPFQPGYIGDEILSQSSKEQQEFFDQLSLKGFFKGALPSLLFANRDLHQQNFFFVRDARGEYSLKVFDNERSFPGNNNVIKWINNETWIPYRCSFIDFPHAEYPITGSLREELKKKVNSWPDKFHEFKHYLKSSLGRSLLRWIPYGKFSHFQLEALKERIDRLRRLLSKEGELTFKDMVHHLFPCYPLFYNLSKPLYPSRTADWTGYLSAETLFKYAVKGGRLTEEKASKYLAQLQEMTRGSY